MLLILLFIVLPLTELKLLIAAGALMGWPLTLASVVLTGVVGAQLARSQGLAAWARLQSEMAAGRQPAGALLEAFAILLAGLVLLTPGFLTDALGLLMLIPVTRRPMLAWLGRRMAASGSVFVHVGGSGPLGGRPPGAGPVPGPGGGPGVKDAQVIDDGSARGASD